MKTQCEILLELTARGWTSPLDLFYESGCLRFSARIYELKKLGHTFEDKTISSRGKLGNAVSWKVFRLIKPVIIETAEKKTKTFLGGSTDPDQGFQQQLF